MFKALDNKFMKEKKLIFSSLSIPALFVVFGFLHQPLEYYFRFSIDYKYIYTYGSLLLMALQIFLIFLSFIFGVYIFYNRKRYQLWRSVFSFIVASSLFLYIMTSSLISDFFK
jgi:hypothetical protein